MYGDGRHYHDAHLLLMTILAIVMDIALPHLSFTSLAQLHMAERLPSVVDDDDRDRQRRYR